MTKQQIRKSWLMCSNILERHSARPERADSSSPTVGDVIAGRDHCAWLLERIPGLLAEGRIDKAQRWLSFVHGVMWSQGLVGIEELKRSLMPDGAKYSEDV